MRASWRLAARPFADIPGPTSLPLFGTSLLFRAPFGRYTVQGYKEALADLRRRYGPICRLDGGVGRGVSVLAFEPDDAQTVFAAEGKSPSIVPLQETTQLYRSMRSLSLGLGNMNGAEWYRLRSATQQAMMQPRAVQRYLPLLNGVSKDFVRHIAAQRDAAQEPPHFETLVARWSLESSALLSFEKRLGVMEEAGAAWGQRMIAANRLIFDVGGWLKFRLPFYRYVSTPAFARLVEAEDAFYSEAHKLVDDAMAELDLEPGQRTRELNFMSYLRGREELSREDVAIIALSLFADGLNTTAPALLYNLYTLAKHPEAQDAVRSELGSVVGSWDAEVTAEQLNRLSLLKAAVKETFRLFPVGTEVTRVPDQDLVLSGYQVPAGTPVEMCLTAACMDEGNFERPSEFRPGRWVRGGAEFVGKDVHPFLLLPFGHGPRMCAGRRFAEQDLQLSLARILLRFRVEHVGEPMGQRMLTLLLPKGSTQFKFHDL